MDFTIAHIKPNADPDDLCPAFFVDYKDFIIKEEVKIQPLQDKVKEVAHRLFDALKEALLLSFSRKMLWISFKFTVFEYYGSWHLYQVPSNFIYVAYKTAIWVLQVTWCVITTTGRLYLDKLHAESKTPSLSRYQDQAINLQHLKSKETELDGSSVPPSIQVRQLLGLFDDVQFDDDVPEQAVKPLGCMSADCRKEGRTTFKKEELRANLEQFIRRVEGRTPYVGTPPAYDVPRLMAFYQQIENAVRLSIHKVNQELAAFREEHPNLEHLEGPARQKYHELLQSRARVAIDLAIAGPHCGARYMGEAMTIYYSLYGDCEIRGALEDEILEVLARKRKKIAEKIIARELGSGTHGYTAGMGYLGSVLSLPGTKNIVEHLTTLSNKQELLDMFFGAPSAKQAPGVIFKSYTIDTIIKTLQKRARKSQEFREKIYDWVKNQVGEWNKEAYEALKTSCMEPVKAIYGMRVEVDAEKERLLRDFYAFAAHNYSNHPAIAAAADWKEFVDAILGTQQAQRAYTQTQRKAIQDMCGVLQEYAPITTEFRSAVARQVSPKQFDFNPLLQSLALEAKISQIMGVFMQKGITPPRKETIVRMIQQGDDALEGFLHDHLERVRAEDFASRVAPINAERELPKEMMEWLLVSHHVLITQAPARPQERTTIKSQEHSQYFQVIKEYFASSDLRVFHGLDWQAQTAITTWLSDLEQSNGEAEFIILEAQAHSILKKYPQIDRSNKNRYQFKDHRYSMQLMNIIFDYAYCRPKAADAIVKAAEAIVKQPSTFYSNRKKITHIHLTKGLADIVGNVIFRCLFALQTTNVTRKVCTQLYDKIQDFTARVIIPLYINHTPIKGVRLYNLASDRLWEARNWLAKRIFRVAIYYWITRFVILRLKINIPLITPALRQWSMLNVVGLIWSAPLTIATSAGRLAWDTFNLTMSTCSQLAHHLHCFSENAEHERVNSSRDKALNVWNTMINERYLLPCTEASLGVHLEGLEEKKVT